VGFRPIYASPQIEAMFGYTPAEWIADPTLWERLILEEDRERTLEENERAMRERRQFRATYRVRARDGRIVWVRESSRPVLDPSGEILQWHGVMFDITEEERARDERALSRRIDPGQPPEVSDGLSRIASTTAE